MAGEIRANRNSLLQPIDGDDFRRLAENIPTLCWIADADGYIVWYNQRWYDYTGTTPEDMEGWGWQSVHDPRTLPDVLERWSAAIASGRPFEMVFPIKGADGVFRPFLTRINPAFDESGKVVNWFGVNTDISPQVRAEDAATASEAKFRVLADSMPQMVWSTRADGHHDYFNAQWYEYTGVPIGSTDGEAWSETVHPDDRAKVWAAWRRALETGAPCHVEYRVRHRSGRYRWVLSRALPDRARDGRISRWYGTCTDIEEIVEARTVLQRSRDELEREVAARTGERNLLARIVETTDVMIMALDRDYRIIAVNKANVDEFDRIFGIRPAVGDNLFDLLTDQPEQCAVAKEIWARAMGGEEFTFVDSFGDPSRALPYYEIKLRSLCDDSGALVGAFQFVTDITDKRKTDMRLAQAQEALRQSQKLEAMGQLTGGVAHDFNNLLTPIIGSLDLLQRRGVGGEREQRLIHVALRSAERAKLLVQRLLAFARRQPLQSASVDIGALVRGMAGLIASTAGPQIVVDVAVAPDLRCARADANQLEMAILNLSVNARDAMSTGGRMKISATAESVGEGHPTGLGAGGYIRLSVADDGVGMDEATRIRAIEPFFSTKGVGKGTGLGLSMAHGLASQLGGVLTIESTVGAGTEVSIWLPEDDESNPAVAPPDPPEADRPHVGTVLLVDDEEDIRISTADMLSDLGFRVYEAPSASAALVALDDGLEPDLLITDHLMPGMTGVELAKAAKARRPGIRLLIVSGFSETEGIDATLPRLTKPFVQSDLAAALADAQIDIDMCAPRTTRGSEDG